MGDTAVSVKTEATDAKSEEGHPQIEVKVPDEAGNACIEVNNHDNNNTQVPDDEDKDEDEDEDEGDDGDFFEMDEDTYHFYQQAEQEADNKATEAQSKAIGSFCNIIFQTVIAALFVVKLNQVYAEQEEPQMDGTSSFSSFWILFPFLVISGCIVCCFACAIFGADSLDSAMSSDDASENGENGGGDEEAVPAENNDPVTLTPPPPQGESVPTEKNDDASTAQVSESENAGNGTAESTDAGQENAMDDLD